MTGLLERHIAVVTGGGSGIGRAIALGYAREGAQVAVLDADGDTAAATVKAITGAGGKALSLRLDVTERDKCRDVAAQIGATIGQVSILVNNAGINRRNAFTADPEAVIKDWQDIMAVIAPCDSRVFVVSLRPGRSLAWQSGRLTSASAP